MNFINLSNEQRRQLIDVRQTFEAYQIVSKQLVTRYSGSMRWLTRKGHDYLHRKRGHRESSLGPRSKKTEETFDAFQKGRAQKRKEATRLAARLDEMAPVNRALGLGRVPRLTARVLRQLDKAELLGKHLWIAGTNALFAYEAASGVQLSGDMLATTDADLLWDVRKRIALLTPEVKRKGILGQLRKVDASFQLQSKQDYRAFNADGFRVDLICPEETHHFRQPRSTVGDTKEDLHGVPIFGLTWLLNTPRFESVTVGEDGYPLRFVTVDPRAFALHKFWLSEREDRDPVKVPRDLAQAETTAQLAQRYLALHFDETALQALPSKLRTHISRLEMNVEKDTDLPEPTW